MIISIIVRVNVLLFRNVKSLSWCAALCYTKCNNLSCKHAV